MTSMGESNDMFSYFEPVVYMPEGSIIGSVPSYMPSFWTT